MKSVQAITRYDPRSIDILKSSDLFVIEYRKIKLNFCLNNENRVFYYLPISRICFPLQFLCHSLAIPLQFICFLKDFILK